jgi:hypothetical protein
MEMIYIVKFDGKMMDCFCILIYIFEFFFNSLIDLLQFEIIIFEQNCNKFLKFYFLFSESYPNLIPLSFFFFSFFLSFLFCSYGLGRRGSGSGYVWLAHL